MTHGLPFRFDLREVNGALGDLGTLLPLVLGTIGVCGLAPLPVLVGFGLFYVATAIHYRLPVPVQPMKAVAAVMLATQPPLAVVAASGVMIGFVLIILGATGWIDRLGRAVPQSVMAGLQLGLGIALALVGAKLAMTWPVVGIATLALLVGLGRLQRVPAALIAVVCAAAVGAILGGAQPPSFDSAATPFAWPATLPTWSEMSSGITTIVLPQMALTLTNAILLTALVAGDCFGERASHVTPRSLSLTSGIANVALAPFGALPMCHGAGGLVAHHRFGARSGGAPMMLGALLVLLALLPGGLGTATLAAIPPAALGALLLVASAELAFSKRLFDCKPSCRPVIAIVAIVTVLVDPFWGLVAGALGEWIRVSILAHLRRRASER